MLDEFPILAVAATQAKGRTLVRDAAELRVKETDRVKATIEALRSMGAQMIACPDGYEVFGPTRLKGAVVNGQGDHRLALALAVAGLLAEGETILKQADVIAENYPGFHTMLQSIGATVEIR
jgi:3-phosphoshikimate 1-carboxyvinyltransferase